MKNKLILLLTLLFFTNCFAQKENNKTPLNGVVTPSPNVVSESCIENIRLFSNAVKNKQFKSALVPWTTAYAECPGANKAIYTKGREILQWQLAQEKNAALYHATFEKLMTLYDNRVKYFGTDTRYPTPWILGLKALDYIAFVKDDELKKPAYGWLELSIDSLGVETELEVLRQFEFLSSNIYKSDNGHAEKYLADYLKVNSILDKLTKNADQIKQNLSIQIKQDLEIHFRQSAVANCNSLDNICKKQISDNNTNIDYLYQIIQLYKSIHCTQSEVYKTAIESVHAIQPTVESANACAETAYKKSEFTKAIEYYTEATRLSIDKLENANFQYKIAQIYYIELKNASRARKFARNSLDFNPKNGKPYILIGTMYANSTGIYQNPILSKTVYWVAVDQFLKAKQVDPACAKDADKLIRTYSAYFPTKDDLFFQSELQTGKSFLVGGWIGENTICRYTKLK